MAPFSQRKEPPRNPGRFRQIPPRSRTHAELRIICIGSFWGTNLASAPKAQDDLIRAFSAVNHSTFDLRLQFSGTGSLIEEARKLAASTQAERKIDFLGVVEDIHQIISRAHIVAMPSRWEGLPIALLEATTTGLPAIVSDIPSLTSLSEGMHWQVHKVGDVSKTAALIEHVARNYDEFRELAINDSAIIRTRFSMDKCADRYLNAYQEATDNG